MLEFLKQKLIHRYLPLFLAVVLAVSGILVYEVVEFSKPAHAAISLVAGQVISGHQGGGGPVTLSLALPNNPTPGNFVVVAVVYVDTNGAHTVTSVRDSNNNSYTATTNSPSLNGTTGQSYIFYLANAPANATKNITVTVSSSASMDGWAAEFSGVATVNPLETDAAHGSATSQTNINDPSVSTSNNGDLLIGVAGAQQTITTANSPWTGLDIVQSGDYAEYYIQPSAGSQAVNFTQSPGGQWTSMIAAFKAAPLSQIPSQTRIRGGSKKVTVRGAAGTGGSSTPIALVSGQTVSGHQNGSSPTILNISLPNNPTAGNFVTVAVVVSDTAATVTIVDGNSNSYTKTPNSPSTNVSASTRSFIFYLANAPANASKNLTITATGGAIDAWVGEFSGVIASSPLETEAAHSGTTNQTNINDPSINTSNNGDLLIGVAGPANTITSANSPWTGLSTVQNGNYAEYYIQPSAGSQAISFTQNSAGQWSAMIAAFKAAPSAESSANVRFR